MNQFFKVLRIAGQVTMLSLLFFLAYVLIDLKLPGQRTFTDQDQVGWALFGTLFYVLAFGLLINSIFQLYRNHWRNYRIIVAVVTTVIIFLVISPREKYVNLLLGKPDLTYTRVDKNENYLTASVSIKLFENGKFLSETYDAHLNNENIGNYIFENGTLKLDFENEQSEYMGTEYKIINDTLQCMDCSEKVKLIKN